MAPEPRALSDQARISSLRLTELLELPRFFRWWAITTVAFVNTPRMAVSNCSILESFSSWEWRQRMGSRT